MLSEQVVQNGLVGSDEEQEKAFERIRDSLLLFTARGYFAQAMQSDHHHRYYRKWQEVLQIPQLYDEVRNEVRDMYERATLRLRKKDDEREKREEEREKRVEKRLSLLGLLFAVPALILGLLGVNIRGYTSGEDGLALPVVVGWLMGGFALAALSYWFLTKVRDKDET
jgi:Mg2+ and Co2+ transporter CorA